MIKQNRKLYFILLVILIITFISYFNVLKNGFTNWDDQIYVTENPQFIYQGTGSFHFLLTNYYAGNYHPLTMLSLALEYKISGQNPFLYHLTNLILHLLNTLLVFIFTRKLFKNDTIALITAAFFGLHTIHVESVAWIAERKDVLYAAFYLLSLIFYLKFLENPTNKGFWIKNKYYLLCLGFFLLSLLSKAQAVTLSLVLFLIDYYRGGKMVNLKRDINKIPFLVLSLFFGIIALMAQKFSGAITDKVHFALVEKIIMVSAALTDYLYKLILPVHLSAFYPYPVKYEGHLLPEYWFYLVTLVCFIALAVFALKKSRILTFCFFFFLLNLMLVLQILPVGGAFMADRYLYLPSIGFFILFAYGIHKIAIFKENKTTIVLYIILGSYLVLLSFLTFKRAEIWKDSITLWTDVLNKYPKTERALINRGNAYFDQVKYSLAGQDYYIALSVNPSSFDAYLNRGRLKAIQGDLIGAIADQNQSILIWPQHHLPYFNRAILYSITGKKSAALADLNKCLELRPDKAEAYYYRAILENEMGMKNEACRDVKKSISLGYNVPKDEAITFCKGNL
jgi:protein O-mannosyl-transferase